LLTVKKVLPTRLLLVVTNHIITHFQRYSNSSHSAVRHESQVFYDSATQFPQFDVSFPEKLLKIVATRGEIVSLKFGNLHAALNSKEFKAA